MSEPLQFFVAGHPKAQGSKRHVGRGVLVESSRDLAPWRKAIAEEARATADGQLFSGPTRVRAVFWFQRPSSHYGTGRNAGQLKPSAPTFRDSLPDVDKCVRALLDALVIAGVLRDDRLVVQLFTEKRYGAPGVLVELAEVSDLPREAGLVAFAQSLAVESKPVD